MTVQVRNPELVELLRPDFQARFEPQFAWGNIVSAHLLLPILRAFWPMSSADSNFNIYDLSGQGRTLTNNNNVNLTYAGLAPIADFIPGSLHFFSRADEAGLDITSLGMTLEAWVKIDILPAGNSYGLIGKWITATNNRAYYLYHTTGAGNPFAFSISSLGTAASVVTVTSAVTTAIDTWYHVVARWSPGTELAIFVNGVKTVNTVGIPAGIFNSSAQLCVGARSEPQDYLDGKMHLATIAHYPLPDTHIRMLFEISRPLFGA